MTLEQIARELAEQLEAWLDAPNSASEGLDELRNKLQALGGIIGKKAASDALRALHGSERDIRRSRQREAADRLVEVGRPLGIPLVAGMPLKRQRKAAPAPKKLGGDPSAAGTPPPMAGKTPPPAAATRRR
jgi:hypothetical protein